MSFVLEAMKKREAASDPDAAVALARQATDRRRYRLWAGLFVVAMTVNVVVLAWVFGVPLLRDAEPPAALEAAPAAKAAPAAETAPAAEPAPAVDTAPAADIWPAANPRPEAGNRPAADRQPAATERMPAATETGPAAAGTTAPEPSAPATVDVDLRNLPADARARFPGLAFSTHIYAQDADLRAIVANGERLQEGDRIRGLQILEITETGVILAFERYRVSVPIVTEW